MMATFDELRARWVGVMEREPVLARQAGPPSWMVLEVQEKGEAFLEAALRLRREMGLDEPVTKPVTKPVTVGKPVTKPVTGKRGPAAMYTDRAARQRAYRGRRGRDG